MAPRFYNSNTYKDGVKLDLERLKKNEIQKNKCKCNKNQHQKTIHRDWNIK